MEAIILVLSALAFVLVFDRATRCNECGKRLKTDQIRQGECERCKSVEPWEY